MREVPESLTRLVWELGEAIAGDPYGKGPAALESLRALYESYESAGKPDPFLTEALADRVADPREAIRLYEAAIAQCAKFPGEPIHTKRRDMAMRLLDIGEKLPARAQLTQAIVEATRAGDLHEARHLTEFIEKFLPEDGGLTIVGGDP
jgi:hypothetical protein